MKPLINVVKRDGGFVAIAQDKTNPAGELLALFLEHDVQESESSARELMGQIRGVRDSSHPKWRRVGNAFILHVNPDGAEIEMQYPDDSLPPNAQLTLDQLEDGVERWLNALSGR